jgi:DNA-binding NarL/FixJ family response regulator
MPLAPTPRLPAACRVVLIDDHSAIIEMLQQVVESVPGYKVVGSAPEVGLALELCRREQPDLIVLDLVLPPASGLALLGDLQAACPRARVINLTGYLPPASIQRALSSGVHGLVEKMAALDEFREAMRAVSSGKVYFCRAASEEIRNMVNLKPTRTARLTEREKSVLQAIANGYSSKEISTRLGISVHTVVNHRTRLMKKTGLRGAAQLARYATQIGLVEDVVSAMPGAAAHPPVKGPESRA